MHKTKLRNLENLRHRILEESALIQPDFIKNAMTRFYNRIAQCQMNGALSKNIMINEHPQNVLTMSITFQVIYRSSTARS